jgi:hypothetical protein
LPMFTQYLALFRRWFVVNFPKIHQGNRLSKSKNISNFMCINHTTRMTSVYGSEKRWTTPQTGVFHDAVHHIAWFSDPRALKFLVWDGIPSGNLLLWKPWPLYR